VTKLRARWSRMAGLDNLDGYVHTMLVRTFLDEKRRGWWKVRLAPPRNPRTMTNLHLFGFRLRRREARFSWQRVCVPLW
jgi:hypothetical protein